MPEPQLYSPADEACWRHNLSIDDSVFGSVEFAHLVANHLGVSPCLLVLNNRANRVVYPFFVRSLDALPFGHPAQYCDAVTPEFTGPIGLTPSACAEFSESACEALREFGVIAEFMHLHPWQVDASFLQGGLVRLNREIVWVDVTLGDNDLWEHHFSHACRKNLKRAQKENVRVFEASGPGDLREFHRIYRLTMDRNHALSSYYFGLSYFEFIFDNLPKNSRFVLAEAGGTVIAATLYLHDRENVYSYLGGADYQYQCLRPTNAIVYETINWARSSGKKRLILGGGYRPDDGIFKFKSSFSNLRMPFYTYQRILEPQVYKQLECGWCNHFACSSEDTQYFPVYRSSAPARSEAALVGKAD